MLQSCGQRRRVCYLHQMLAAIVSAKLYSLKPSEIQRVSVDSLLRVQPSPMLLYTVSPSQLPDWLLFCVTPVTFSR